MEPTSRTLSLPPAGVMSLLTALGILEDQGAVPDVARYLALTNRLHGSMSPQEWARLSDDPMGDGPAVALELDMAEAAMVLEALAFTEAMSTELPWYPAVISTVRFIGDELTGLWSDDEWLAWRDAGHGTSQGRRGFAW